MLIDDLEPTKSPPKLRQLDPMSIDELRSYVVELRQEISRVEAAIAAKEAHRANIDAIFRTPS